ncbi:MAG: nucleoside phosphorylase [Firmicutes bacterium]|nr:nucleoside phosphorylase [Bacillota bacterium]
MPRYCLIPGDPGRAERIADLFDNKREVIRNREYVAFVGEVDGVPVSVCSTGIGGPSASIAVEELANIGVDTFIRVGSAGGRQPNIPIGSVAIINAAHREDGTSRAYLPPEFPAVADLTVTNALVEAARRLDQQVFVGIGTTRDAFYQKDQELTKLLTERGHVVAAEQEAAPVFIVATVRQVRAGAVVAIDSNIWLPKPEPEEVGRRFRAGEAAAIRVALEAVKVLAEWDGVAKAQ